jgi:hypothetical protein
MKRAILNPASVQLSMPQIGCFVTSKSSRVFAAQKRRAHPHATQHRVACFLTKVEPDGFKARLKDIKNHCWRFENSALHFVARAGSYLL